jgi:autotransporter-associated beta strand protein
VIDGPGGSFSLGTNSSANQHLDIVTGGQPGQIHNFINNSTNAARINQDVRWRAGGGGAHTYVFDGTGDWIINHDMIGANNSPNVITKTGSGTMTWFYAKTDSGQNSSLQGPQTIEGGLQIRKNAGLFPTIVQTLNNDATLRWDAGSDSDSFGGTIAGVGSLQVTSGTLSLGGPNTFTGNISLSGGELIANGGENPGVSGPLGVGGLISFSGGILGFGNNSFDYSSRFDPSPGQAYKIDTGAGSVTFTNNLGSSGGTLTKTGFGSLTLAGPDTYNGLTTVAQGKLILAGTASAGNITVDDNAAIGVVENGTPFAPNTLTIGTSLGAIFEVNNMTNKLAAPMHPVNLASAGPTTINVNSGLFRLIGDTFPTLSWSSGTPPPTSLGFLAGAGGHLVTNISGKEIDVVIDQPPYIWTGSSDATWVAGGQIDWIFNGNTAPWANANYALFDDTLLSNSSITISGLITGKTITFNNVNTNYTLTSPDLSDNLSGGSSLLIAGSGTVTLVGQNTYTNPTTITGGGTLSTSDLQNGGVASDIGQSSNSGTNLVINSGTLIYTGPGVSIDRLFSLGTASSTIDIEGTGPFTFNNPGKVVDSGRLTLSGSTANTNTLACALVGGGSLVKAGTGTLVLSGTNAYGGGTTVSGGVLQVGAGGGSGSIGSGGASTGTGTSIDFQRSGTLTVGGRISGSGSVSTESTGTVILANNNSYSGGTTINSGTLQVGSGGSAGELYINGPIVNNATLAFLTTGTHNYVGTGLISGTGNVTVGGGGWIKAIGQNSYTGSTVVDGGGTLLPTTFQPCEGNTGAFTSSGVNIINGARLVLIRQDNGVFTMTTPITSTGNLGPPSFPGVVFVGANNNNVGDVTLLGTNNYGTVATVGLSGTYIGCNRLILGDNATPRAGEITGNVTFTNNLTTTDDNTRALRFNRPDSFTFSGNIVTNFATPQLNLGIVELNGGATVTLTGNNTYAGGTVVGNGALVIGNGGASGSIGWGTLSLGSGNPLLINRSGTMSQTIDNISGGADVYITGGVALTFNGANNTYSGGTWVTNGTLTINGNSASSETYVYAGGLGGSGTFSGPVTLTAGTTFSPGAANSVGTFTVNNSFTNDASSMVIDINKLLSPSNDIVNVSGTLARDVTGGTMTVHNRGPQDLVPGDKFTLFSQPLPNGASITVSGGRATWTNNLALDGSISVVTVISTQPVLNFSRTTTNTLVFSWSDPYTSFKLQSQTNSLKVGVSNYWLDYPNGGTSPVTVPIVKTNPTAFYRLVSIP